MVDVWGPGAQLDSEPKAKNHYVQAQSHIALVKWPTETKGGGGVKGRWGAYDQERRMCVVG